MFWILFLAAISIGSDAASACDKPEDPGCPTIGRFENADDVQACRTKMENYKHELDRYVACLDQGKKDAISEFNESLDRFNCYAEGGKDCP